MMKKLIVVGLLLFSAVASAQFVLTSSAFNNNGYIPYKYGLCQPDGHGQTMLSANSSPPLKWSGEPQGTKSYALVMADHTMPQRFAIRINTQEIPKDFPREIGYLWLIVNIPGLVKQLPEKAGSNVTGPMHYGIQGMNYYSNIEGVDRGGYAGPCPPATDTITHHYIFTLYALDQASLNIAASGAFTGFDVLRAIKGHVLGKAILIGKYSTKSYNQHLR